MMQSFQNLSAVSRYSLLFLLQLILLVLCLVMISLKYADNIRPDKRVAEVFALTNCTVVGKVLTTEDTHFGKGYRADFTLDYLANGVNMRGAAGSNGLDYTLTSDVDSQQELLDEYQVGLVYSCWYDLQNPQTVVLILRHSWGSALPLIIPSIAAVLLLFFLFSSGANLMRALAAKRSGSKG